MKRIMRSMVALSLATSVLASCGGTSETSSTEGSTEGGEEVVLTGEIGTESDPVELTMLMKDLDPKSQDVIDFVEVLEANMAAEGKYVDLEILEAPAGKYAEVVPLAVRTGQIAPDLVYFQGGDLQIANEGYLTDLTPYLEQAEYIPNIMQDHNKQRLESYPYLIWLSPARTSVPVMRKDVFESLETGEALLADPTVDNYYAFLTELKEDYDMVITADSLDRIDSVFESAFGITQSIVEQDGKYVYSEVTDATKDKLEFYNKLYADGIIDNELFTNTWDVAEGKFYEGDSAILIGTAGTVIDIYDKKMVSANGPEAELVVLPPAKGVAQSYASVDVSKESRGWAIHADSQNKEAAFAVLDYMASQEGRLIDLVGLEGKQYNVENNQIVRTDAAAAWWPRVWETTYNFEPPYEIANGVLADSALDSLDKVNQYYTPDNNVILPDEYLPSLDAMKIVYTDFSAEVIRGTRSIDEFQSFVDEWNANGGDNISEYLATVMQ